MVVVVNRPIPSSRLLFVFVAAPDNLCIAGIHRGQGGVPEASATQSQNQVQNQVKRSSRPSVGPTRAEGGTGGRQDGCGACNRDFTWARFGLG